MADHSFPLDQEQLQVLDHVKEEIEYQPPLRRLALRVQANPWMFAGLTAACGFLLGFRGKARR